MKVNIEHIKMFSFHLAKEFGYTGNETLEGLKTFLTDKYNITWDVNLEKIKQYKAKYSATIKPNLNEVTAYTIYAKNEWYLVETVLFRLKELLKIS